MKHKYSLKRPVASFDTECYANYWSIGFRCIETGRQKIIEKYDGCELDVAAIASLFRKWRVVGFNSIKYDMPMIMLAMSGVSNMDLKRASDEIIKQDMQPWKFYERYDLGGVPNFIDHIDLMEVSPGSPTHPSLKQYAGRMHSKEMQDLPFAEDSWITEEDRAEMRSYLGKDLLHTAEMYQELEQQIELRAQLSDEYGVDVRSKSDAQVAEAVIKAAIQSTTGKAVYKPDLAPSTFFFEPPPHIRFQTPAMQERFEAICKTEFEVVTSFDKKGQKIATLLTPPLLDVDKDESAIQIGQTIYQMGLGGLHSKDDCMTHFSDDECTLRDRDVTSYYPKTIISTGLFPKHLGVIFLKVYEQIYKRRIKAKAEGLKNIAETLKIVCNGTFGKFGSSFSIMFAPKLMIQTTLTGQLSILMLIEALELEGFRCVSANTDGVVTKVPNDRLGLFNAMVFDWEMETDYTTEEVEYLSIHSRDVNNYFAIAIDRKNGKIDVKSKGAFGPSGRGHKGAMGLKKNVDCEIANEAVIEYLKNQTPIEKTINECNDIRKFFTIRKVDGGAEKDGAYVGKVIRYYYAEGVNGGITYVRSGNKVPITDGAKPCMVLPDECPDDIDRQQYIIEAKAILRDVGLKSDDPRLEGRKGTIVGRLDDEKTWHMISLPSGVAHCGKQRLDSKKRPTFREPWVEAPDVPIGQRLCKKCVEAATL